MSSLNPIAHLWHLFRLPPRIVCFYARSVGVALRSRDRWSLAAYTRPRELRALLRAARGRTQVVEHGTANAWTAIALALGDPRRHVATYDPAEMPHREQYLALVPDSVRSRIELVHGPAERPLEHHRGADFLFMDGPHHKLAVIRDFRAWRDLLATVLWLPFTTMTSPPGRESPTPYESWGSPARPTATCSSQVR